VATLMNNSIARFLVCGGSAALINWLARIGFSPFMPFIPAVIMAYAIGMVAGFILYRTLVWPTATTQSWQQQVPPFIVVNLLGAAVVLASSLAIIALGTSVAGPSETLDAAAHGLGIGIGAVFNYLGHNRITFKA
jgi:energy-coupling factor transport system substrate-specific component